MINKKRMKAKAESFGILLSDDQLSKLDLYAELLVDWNSRMNLTAIVEADEIETKHFLDCLLAAKMCSDDESIADVGTGAGFPGVVIKIFKPNARITLIDGLEKRLGFLKAVGKELCLDMDYVHGRAEDVGHMPEYRQKFSLTTARAVAPMNILAEYCLPLTAVGGRMLAMKGKTDEELESASSGIEILGGRLSDKNDFALPDGSERQIIIVEKINDTPDKYPRRAPVIKKKPL